LWALPLVIPIISGVGRILGERGFLEVAMATYSICQIQFPSIKAVPLDQNDQKELVKEL
jgi:hypothetical protein